LSPLLETRRARPRTHLAGGVSSPLVSLRRGGGPAPARLPRPPQRTVVSAAPAWRPSPQAGFLRRMLVRRYIESGVPRRGWAFGRCHPASANIRRSPNQRPVRHLAQETSNRAPRGRLTAASHAAD